MPYLPTIPVRPTTVQRTVTFRGVQRAERIREGEWYAAENLTSAYAPVLAARGKRTRAAVYGGTVLAVAPSDPLAVLVRPENDPDTVVLHYGEASARFACPTAQDPGGIVRMGAALVLPGLDAWFDTVSGASGTIGSHYVYDASLGVLIEGFDGDRDLIYAVYPCSEDGSEIFVNFRATDAEIAALQTALGVTAYRCYASEQAARTEFAVRDGGIVQVARTPLEGEMAHDADNKRFLRYSAEALAFQALEGTYIRVSAPGIGADLRVGDAVTFTLAYEPNQTRIQAEQRELDGLRTVIAAGEDYIVISGFMRYAGAYTRCLAPGDAQLSGTIRRDRSLPDMDFVVEAQNRLWGCKYGETEGVQVNELYASALGDFRVWRRYDGLSTASWAASVGSEGPFTGAAVLDGCPVFFKETVVHRVYPAASGAHRVLDTRVPGVAAGCAKSLASFDGALCYVSHMGVVRWAGGSTAVLSEALGPLRAQSAAAGAWGRQYYLALTDLDGGEKLWVYDAAHETWLSESAPPEGMPVCFAAQGQSLYAAAGGALWDLRGLDGTPEDTVAFSCTSGLVGYAVTEQKYVSRFVLRLTLPRGSRLDVWLEYDSDGVWRHAGHVRGQGTGSFLLPVRPHRCDHFRLRLTGTGDLRLYSIVKHMQKGSDVP